MDITYKEFNEQMDVVGIAITEVLNDKADNISRVSVAAALIEVLSDLVVYDRPDGQDKDLPEEWVFAMLRRNQGMSYTIQQQTSKGGVSGSKNTQAQGIRMHSCGRTSLCCIKV